jgi:hypothetical protein
MLPLKLADHAEKSELHRLSRERLTNALSHLPVLFGLRMFQEKKRFKLLLSYQKLEMLRLSPMDVEQVLGTID